jgi:hypothetical protein
LATVAGETQTSTMPERTDPRRRKGTPSRMTLRNEREKSPKENWNQLIGFCGENPFGRRVFGG